MNNFFSNLMSLKNNPHAAYSIYGAVLLELLKVWLPPGHEAQIAATQKILTWYGILAATTTGQPTPPPAGDSATDKKPGPVTMVLLLCFTAVLFTGCSNPAARAVADIVKSNADSKAHVKMEVDIPPNRITYERWVAPTNSP